MNEDFKAQLEHLSDSSHKAEPASCQKRIQRKIFEKRILIHSVTHSFRHKYGRYA